MDTLRAEHGDLTIIGAGMVDGIMCAMVDCYDYDYFRSLPSVVSYQGTKLGKTGWNSDTQRAHYQSNAPMVRIERW